MRPPQRFTVPGALRVAPALASLAAPLLLALALPSTVHAAPPPASAAIAAVATHCAASVEQAARGIFGDVGTASTEGYRVQDLVVDPILRKAWIRVADCHDGRRPLTLVPLAASLAGTGAPSGSPAPPAGLNSPAASAATLPAATAMPFAAPDPRPSIAPAGSAPILIARGDAVEILVQSSNVRMTLEGHATTAAAAGEPLDVVLDAANSSTPGEAPAPPHHLRGIASGAHRVEVQR